MIKFFSLVDTESGGGSQGIPVYTDDSQAKLGEVYIIANLPPSVPSGLAASNQTSTSVRISWNASTDPEGNTISYELYKDGIYQTTVSTNYVDVENLTEGTYSFTVAALDNKGGKSYQSTPISVTILLPSGNTDLFDTLDTNAWGISTAGAGSVTASGGCAVINSQGGMTNAAVMYRKTKVAKTSKTYKVKIKLSSGGAQDSMIGIGLAQALPTVDSVANFYANKYSLCGIYFSKNGTVANIRAMVGKASNNYRWASTNQWVADGGEDTSVFNMLTGTIYTFIITTSATGFKFTVKNADETTTIFNTTEVIWSELKVPTGVGVQPSEFYLFVGDPFTDAYSDRIDIDSFEVV